MKTDFPDSPLFHGINSGDIPTVLKCLRAQEVTFLSEERILSAGTHTQRLGLVLSGLVIIEHSDAWGNVSILGSAGAGDIFGEAYACLPSEPLMIDVTAAKDTVILMLDAERIYSPCQKSCPFHTQLMQNLLTVCAAKSLQLSKKILHTGPRSIRRRLMSYFSECILTNGNRTFDIPYSRQQLADYLNVDRSALSAELSRMQKEGLIRYHKNHFEVLD